MTRCLFVLVTDVCVLSTFRARHVGWVCWLVPRTDRKTSLQWQWQRCSALVLPPMQSCDLMPVSGMDRLETNHLLVFQYSPFGASHTLWSSAVFLHSLWHFVLSLKPAANQGEGHITDASNLWLDQDIGQWFDLDTVLGDFSRKIPWSVWVKYLSNKTLWLVYSQWLDRYKTVVSVVSVTWPVRNYGQLAANGLTRKMLGQCVVSDLTSGRLWLVTTDLIEGRTFSRAGSCCRFGLARCYMFIVLWILYAQY